MKKFKLIKVSMIAATVFLAACSTATAKKAVEPTKENYEKLVVEATAALDKAASLDGEWRDSRWSKSEFVSYTAPDGTKIKSSYMGAAAEAAKHGDYAKAIQFVETAKFQGEMGYQQAVDQKNAGPRL